MADLSKVLKSEIARISRKEVNSAVGEIRKSNILLKKLVADLKKRVVFIEKENKRLRAAERKAPALSPQRVAEEAKTARITSKGIRSLRSRLGLTRPDFAKLCGTTAQTVYVWETKDGALKMRGNTRAALLSIKGLGAREARSRLVQAETNSSKVKAG
ncbi:MAG: hypothetical protein ABII26_09110, partial [Pseudomonadota bacterium]